MIQCTNLNEERISLDIICNKQGRILNEFMEENCFVLLNGRTASDSPANYTYCSSNGNSIVDLIWYNSLNTSEICNLEVDTCVSLSDHFPVMLSVYYDTDITVRNKNTIKLDNKFVWDDNKKVEFMYYMRFSPRVGFISNTETCELMYQNLILAISEGAYSSGLMKNKHIIKNKYKASKPWFDSHCRNMKKRVKSDLQLCKRSSFNSAEKDAYLLSKKQYRNILINKKRQHEKDILDKLAQVNNSCAFWQTINKFKYNYQINVDEFVPVESWETFYNDIYVTRIVDNTNFFDVRHPNLDAEISLIEICTSLTNCKNGKASGMDKIGSEFYKNLSENWILYLCVLFNKIFDSENLPAPLAEVEMRMLFKKGEKTNPANYRGIALLNSLTKIFTQILLKRVTLWAEEMSVIPECQSGFRRARGCADNIFVLSSVIQMQLRLKKGVVFGLFVDFQRAFDSVNHLKLWEALYSLGLSGKIIRLLKSLYSKASMRVKVGTDFTKSFDITEGVLQGESMSPLLFNLFISDIENYFYANGARGLNINGKDEVLMLMYADDLVILGHSVLDINKKLSILENYCSEKGLHVNVCKTEIVRFNRGGKNPENLVFKYNKRNVNVVNRYVYLGIPFVSSSLFLETSNNFVSKTNMAIGSVLNILSNCKANSWFTRMKLYDSIVLNTLLYGAPVWSLRYLDQLEQVQVNFFKKLLLLSRYTPNYIVRLETGTYKLALKVLKLTLTWLINLLQMKDGRLPKICFQRLCILDKSPINNIKYNWSTQVRCWLERLGFGNVWVGQDINLRELKNNTSIILNSYQEKLRQEDLERLEKSEFCKYYKYLNLVNGTQPHLTLIINISFIRIFSQLRTVNSLGIRLIVNKTLYYINTQENCSICNINEKENLRHLLFVCPMYAAARDHFLNSLEECAIMELLTMSCKKKLIRLVNYIKTILKIRSFILNE